MRSDELDFELPDELIAQVPAENRGDSRLLHYRKLDRLIEHRAFSDLPSLLHPGDLLVFNDAQVVPARFMLRKNTGGRIEGLFLGEPAVGEWRVLLRGLGNVPIGTRLIFTERPEVTATIISPGVTGEYRIAVSINEAASVFLNRIGRMPLPPYIRRGKEHDTRDEFDRDRYQTVYAAAPGSVAAPTAGLHFSPEILQRLVDNGIEQAFVTLDVGMGTFKPVTADDLANHVMHTESFTVRSETAEKLNRAEAEHRRIIAVGTTAARVLESWPANEPWRESRGETAIFIYPPYQWKRVTAMITNFHLPKSTLIALVASLVGLDEQRRIYATAIASRYRFFSYGDAMFIE